eukprot:SAG11_NODE_1015_length_6172_cov_13.477359_5_plen_164_part_00
MLQGFCGDCGHNPEMRATGPVQGCIINEKIYLTGHLTLPNCHDPAEGKAAIKKLQTFVRNPMAHVPSCLMDMSGDKQRVKVKLVAPDESEDEDELEDEDEEESDDSGVSEDDEAVRTSLNFTAEDVTTLLRQVDPDINSEGYFAIACIVKNYCSSLFEDERCE